MESSSLAVNIYDTRWFSFPFPFLFFFLLANTADPRESQKLCDITREYGRGNSIFPPVKGLVFLFIY